MDVGVADVPVLREGHVLRQDRVNAYVKSSKEQANRDIAYPLNEDIVPELEVGCAAIFNLASLMEDMEEGKPGPVDPPSPLSQQR